LQAVDELLAVLGADGGLLVKLPAWHYADPALPAGATSLPLRDALARCYDLRQPRPELLALLQRKLAAAQAAAAGGVAAADDNTEAEGGIKRGGPGSRAGRGLQVKTQDSASELSGAAAAAAAHGALCSQGCIVDRLEVRGVSSSKNLLSV
jgi:hypothetical protein